MPSKRPLPHLPTGFGRVLQVNGVDVGFYPYLPRLPERMIFFGRVHALQKAPTPSTYTFWSYFTDKWGRRRFLPQSTVSTPNNKLCMLSPAESMPPKLPLPHPPTGFGRLLHVNRVDVGFYPHLPVLPQTINYVC